MKKVVLILFIILFATSPRAFGSEGSGVYGWSVGLKGCVSGETGRAPSAYMWLPDVFPPAAGRNGCRLGVGSAGLHRQLGSGERLPAGVRAYDGRPCRGERPRRDSRCARSAARTFGPGHVPLELRGVESAADAVHNIVPRRRAAQTWSGGARATSTAYPD